VGVGTVSAVRRRGVFLDRDGVLNRAVMRHGSPYPPSNLDELEITPHAGHDLAELKKLGFVLVVVTNQPDVGRGSQSREAVQQIHQALRNALPVDAILVCYHGDDEGCGCRKPKPGMLLQAASEYAIDLSNSYLVGDRWRDIDAGHRAGCTTILIDFGYAEQKPAIEPHARVGSLREAVAWIQRHEAEGNTNHVPRS
jgi:D-glycero-D-manno-heptose 1,7-bisphosphate phosphatase